LTIETTKGMNMKYRKKPVVIEAWQWKRDPILSELPLWMNRALLSWPNEGSISFEPDHPDGPRIRISALGGIVDAFPNDWIIKGIEGEFYPCKPDIFDVTYEPVV